MKTYGIKALIFILVLCFAIPSVCISATAENAVSLSMSYDGNAYIGGELVLRISVSKPAYALAGLEFILDYDEKYVSPRITENTEEGLEMDAFISKKPNGWEQMCYHSADGSYYHLRFAMPESGNSYLSTAGGLVLEIPFTVIQAGSFEFGINDGDIIAVVADTFAAVGGTGESLTVAASGEAQKLSAEIMGADYAWENGIYNLKIKVTNLGDTAGIIATEFKLAYDNTMFSPTVTSNDSAQMDVFMTDMPKKSWEQMCSLDGNEGIYTLRFAAIHAEDSDCTEALASGSSFTVTVPFRVTAREGDVGIFSVSSASVIALNCVNGVLTGSGSSKSVLTESAPEGVIPDYLGYTVSDGFLYYINEKTEISEFLAPLSGFYLTDASGNEVTEGYVCTGYILHGAETLTIAVRGDINGTGTADTYDYILAKRIYFNTFTPSRLQTIAADANRDGEVNQFDYILIKRHYFGTININSV